MSSPRSTGDLMHFTFWMYMLWQLILGPKLHIFGLALICMLGVLKISEGLLLILFQRHIHKLDNSSKLLLWSTPPLSPVFLNTSFTIVHITSRLEEIFNTLQNYWLALSWHFLIYICYSHSCLEKKFISTSHFPKSQPSKVKK